MPIRPIKFITLKNPPKPDKAANSWEDDEQDAAGDLEGAKFELDPSAIEVLDRVDGPLCIITIAGIYRSGKSFILNQLAGYRDGFNIGSTVEPCTQGIWMWLVEDEMHPRGPDNCRYLLLDTEGLGSYIKTESYDVQIFSLALLLGSFFIYNSINNIDEGAIDKLSLVVQLTKHIRAQAEGDGDPMRLKMYFPSFLWLVRDFALDLNISGKKVTPREYLESALNPMKGDPSKVQGRNQVREFVKSFFADRDCFTLKRPVSDETQLQNLAGLTEKDLRPEYREQVEELKNMIFAKAVPKKINGQLLNGPMFVELARNYVEAMNSGAVLTISTAWENVITQENSKALSSSKEVYESKMKSSSKDKVLELVELVAAHRAAVDDAMKLFRLKAVGGHYWKYEDELKKFEEDLYDRITVKNYAKSQQTCEQTLEQLMRTAEESSSKSSNIDTLEIEWQKMLDSYRQAAVGPAKHHVEARALAKKPFEASKRCHATLMKQANTEFDDRFRTERLRHDEEYKRISKLHDESSLLRKNLETLVSQLSQESMELNRRMQRQEDDNRVLVAENTKIKKQIDRLNAAATQQSQDRERGQHASDDDGRGARGGVSADKCIVM